jgi:hypothetical protein
LHKEEEVRQRAIQIKHDSEISDKKLGRRFKKSVYWVRKTLGKQKKSLRGLPKE